MLEQCYLYEGNETLEITQKVVKEVDKLLTELDFINMHIEKVAR